ncbi:hypothetical protein CMI45_00295 [Candidatus Pacearchaeota archaeon]|nr:hypothetical protein [Candidatus Pacearchaeota archaeon]|tara:strand:- start:1226 stop:2536 length:1311 start_codon:yes stop_codon:yes gene_type:complete
MPYEVIIGRDSADKIKFAEKGLIFLGKSYVKMGNYTSLSNHVFLDIARSHTILLAGKKGSGKSYTLAAMAESITDLPKDESKNIAPIIFDTMGIFWTMKYKNEKDSSLLKEWGLKSKELPIKVFVPLGKAQDYESKGIPYDETFALSPSELEAEDWISIFNLDFTSLPAVLITRAVSKLKSSKEDFTISEIQSLISEDHKSPAETKLIAFSLFDSASSWGIFSEEKKGTQISDLINAGKTTIIDLSVYTSASTFNIRALAISIISKKIFESRIISRKKEEIISIQRGYQNVSAQATPDSPLVWLFIDEAHEFLPKTGSTPATPILTQIIREGRQPGISIVLATQQPGQIHNDVLTQSDIVISHRVTSEQDITALNNIMQSYVLEKIQKSLNDLPSLKGSAIILDDNSERLYPMRVRPRFTWHGGEAPTAISSKLQI